MKALSKESLYVSGVELMERFCAVNDIPAPKLMRLTPKDHVDEVRTFTEQRASWKLSDLFSHQIWSQSKEKPLTGYLGTDRDEATFYKEWFAEHFRLFVTNPDLSRSLAPKFYRAMLKAYFKPTQEWNWEKTLRLRNATPRIMEMAAKKIAAEQPKVRAKVPPAQSSDQREILL